jgi:4-hydroxybenzoyl-CoA reductase subunit beta
VAGGTDLWPNMKRRHQQADTVVGLRSVPGLRGIRESNGEIAIGAMTTLTEVARNELVARAHPAVAQAVASISSPVLRNMGTLGGNLCLDTRCTYYNQNEEWRQSIDYCMKEAGQVCWVAPGSSRCWAISASDSAPALCATGARVKLVSAEGERVIPIPELFADDGIQYLTKRPDEILTEIVLPAPNGTRVSFRKLRRRGSIDFAVLTVATAVELADDGTVGDVRIYLGAVTSFPSPAHEAEAHLRGKKLDEETIAEAARLARKTSTPLDNTDFVPQWRGKMVEKYVRDSLRELA